MSGEDFVLSAVALFVFFFVVMPLLGRLCSRTSQVEKPRVAAHRPEPTTMRRAS